MRRFLSLMNWYYCQMHNVLDAILETKRSEIIAAKAAIALGALNDQISELSDKRDFVEAIQIKHNAKLSSVIAEIKKSQPFPRLAFFVNTLCSLRHKKCISLRHVHAWGYDNKNPDW